MTWWTVLSVVLCLTILTLRFLFMPGRPQRRTPQQRLRFVRILIGALLVLAAVRFALKRDAFAVDGKTAYEPSLVERIVTRLAGK